MPARKHVDYEKVVGKVIKYVKWVLIGLLAVTIMLVMASAVNTYIDFDLAPKVAILVSVALACIALIILECISMYLVKDFKFKMVFFAFECLIMVVLGILTGSVLGVVLFCIVLTECYMTLEKQVDKFICFICSIAFYIISYVIGWVIVNRGTPTSDSVLIILSGCLYGLIALLLDYLIVDFLMYMNKRNIELRRALKEAEDSKAELRTAYAKLAESSVYEERNRIARDIHDNAGHSITAVIMQTEAAKVNMDTDPELAKRSIIAANIQAKNALDQMRASVHLLAGRDELISLKTDIEHIIVDTEGSTDIKIRSDLDDVEVPDNIFRYVSNTVKECLTNGLRHGGATAFYVELKQEGNSLHLLISDNGSGIPEGSIQEGYGLRGIREYAIYLGGTCTFTSEEDEGFETDILLPLPQSAPSPAPAVPAQVPAASPAAAPAATSAAAAAASSAAPTAPAASATAVKDST
ncbi:MAG: sensor histidine kinase, partial [Clostridia bacterium]|nr:sensor histidine kinase [Clostridia bacterium]